MAFNFICISENEGYFLSVTLLLLCNSTFLLVVQGQVRCVQTLFTHMVVYQAFQLKS